MADIDNVVAALNLEYGANRRYGYQVETSTFSRLNNILEGVRRTEGDHVEAMIAYLKQQQSMDPDRGRGFATMLTHLQLNLEFERIALDTYNRFARSAEDPALKKTFQQLSQSEAGHIKLFQQLIERIEANAYPVIVYCPVCGWEIDYGINPTENAVVRCEACKKQIALAIVDGDFTPGIA